MAVELEQKKYKHLGPLSVSTGMVLEKARSLNDSSIKQEDRFVVVVDPGDGPYDPIGVTRVQPKWDDRGMITEFSLSAGRAYLEYYPPESFLSNTRCPWTSDRLRKILQPSPIYPLVNRLLERPARRLR